MTYNTAFRLIAGSGCAVYLGLVMLWLGGRIEYHKRNGWRSL